LKPQRFLNHSQIDVYFKQSKDDFVVNEVPLYEFSNEGEHLILKLKEDLSKKDLEFFIENGARECSSSSDERMQAQRFCFDIKLAGVVYPTANNLSSLKALSKPYQISIYTNKEESYKSKSGMNPLEKLVLLPFAMAIDVVSLPFQTAEKIFD
jgi:hypothetical protein